MSNCEGCHSTEAKCVRDWRPLDADFFPPGVKLNVRGTFTVTVGFTPDAKEEP